MSNVTTLDTSKVYDVSPEELDRMRRRAEIRAKLKAEFNRIHYNPYRQVYKVEVLDPAIQRFMAAKASRYDYWKPTWRSFFVYVGFHFVPIFVLATVLTNRYVRTERNRRLQLPGYTYADRTYKHLYVSGCDFLQLC